MIDEKLLIEQLCSWQDKAKDKPAGFKEGAAYQRVIDLVKRLVAHDSNQEIKQRIMNADLEEQMNRIEKTAQAALDKVERLTETVGAKELKGSHDEGCNECLCYTCVYDDGGSLGDDLPWCCDRHGVECPKTSCKDYRREL